MISITLEYKPLWFLWRRRIDTTLPNRWSDLTPAQLAAIPDLSREKLSDSRALEIFTGISNDIARRIDRYQKYCIIKHLKFIKKSEPVSVFIIPAIAGFKAPGKNLKGVNFGAFIFGDTYFQNYLIGKRDALDKFIACFYYARDGFDQEMIEINAGLIKKIKHTTREAIALNYALIREWLSLAYPYIFAKAESGEKIDNSPGWVKVFDNVVGNDIVRQHDYALLPATEVLRYLNETTKSFYKNGGKV